MEQTRWLCVGPSRRQRSFDNQYDQVLDSQGAEYGGPPRLTSQYMDDARNGLAWLLFDKASWPEPPSRESDLGHATEPLQPHAPWPGPRRPMASSLSHGVWDMWTQTSTFLRALFIVGSFIRMRYQPFALQIAVARYNVWKVALAHWHGTFPFFLVPTLSTSPLSACSRSWPLGPCTAPDVLCRSQPLDATAQRWVWDLYKGRLEKRCMQTRQIKKPTHTHTHTTHKDMNTVHI